MANVKIEAPWTAFQKKVKALFRDDSDIYVGDIYQPEDGRTQYAFDIEVLNHKKFLALDRVMPKTRSFGNVSLGITLFDLENGTEDPLTLYRTVFDGNPNVKDFKEVTDFTGTKHGFVRFKPEVVQFFYDDISDYNGNWSGLAQDIAKEVFTDVPAGIHFCTAAVDETSQPLGEWP